VIFGGDFRQILPVVTKRSRVDVVASSISTATFGFYCNVQHLRTNIRLMHSDLSHDEHEHLGVCIGPGPDRTEDRNGGRLWIEDRAGPAFCLAADRIVARSARATRHGRAT